MIFWNQEGNMILHTVNLYLVINVLYQQNSIWLLKSIQSQKVTDIFYISYQNCITFKKCNIIPHVY